MACGCKKPKPEAEAVQASQMQTQAEKQRVNLAHIREDRAKTQARENAAARK